MLAKIISKTRDEIMESAYKDKNTARGMAKVFTAGFIEGLSNGIIILGTVVLVTTVANNMKNNISK